MQVPSGEDFGQNGRWGDDLAGQPPQERKLVDASQEDER